MKRLTIIVMLLIGVLLAALAPGNAAAKKPEVNVGLRPRFTSTTDPPAGHGSVFPVTISGHLVVDAFLGEGAHKLRKSSKLARKARARCLRKLVLPLAVRGYSSSPPPFVGGRGQAVIDAAGNFSATLQFNSVGPTGEQAEFYASGMDHDYYPWYIRKGKFGGHRFNCAFVPRPSDLVPEPHLIT